MKKSHRIITAQQAAACSEQPLTGLDIGMPVDGFCIALVYAQPLDDLLLIESLQKALNQNPYFSGRLFGIGSTLPLAIPNNEGALFTCNAYTGSMPAFGIDQPLKPHLPRFSHCIQNFGFDHHTPVLQIQLTNFPNGSILAISISHALCDGTSMLEFLQSWSAHALQTSRGTPPCWNRRDVQQMAIGDGSDTSPQSPAVELKRPFLLNTQTVDTATFRLSASILDRLHEKCGKHDSGVPRDDIAQNPSALDPLPVPSHQPPSQAPSHQDMIAAFLYLLLLRCDEEAENGRPLSIVCNIRRILQLPAGYLGNAICLRHFQPEDDPTQSMSVMAMADKIRSLRSEITAMGLRRDLAFWQKRCADGSAAQFIPLATLLALSGGILIDNMSKFGFYELDFGCGKPTWIDTPPPPSPAPVSRGILMLPGPPGLGCIDIHVSLPPAEMANLRSLMKGIDANHLFTDRPH